MKLLAAVAGLAGLAAADIAARRPPTSYESAIMGRRILALTKLGTLSTVFPDKPSSHNNNNNNNNKDNEHDHDHDHAGVAENRPDGLGGIPFGLMDYIADCEGHGDPTILAVDLETSFKNARDGSNVTLSLMWTPPYPPARRIPLLSRLSQYFPVRIPGWQPKPKHEHDLKKQHKKDKVKEKEGHKHHHESKPKHKKKEHEHEHEHEHENAEEAATPDTVPYSAANLPRLALVGYVEAIEPSVVDAVRLTACFLAKHRDAKYWLPGNPVHKTRWMRLVVTNVYWLGGFGDRAYIGWIGLDEWQKVTKEEWKGIRLPGEKKGWSEWSVEEGEEEEEVDEL